MEAAQSSSRGVISSLEKHFLIMAIRIIAALVLPQSLELEHTLELKKLYFSYYIRRIAIALRTS